MNNKLNDKFSKKEEDKKNEILNMSQLDIKLNTKYIVTFEDYGQDFLTWHIDKDGFVLDSIPFQRNIWAGKFTIPQTAEVGGLLAIWLGYESYIKYPIKNIIEVNA